METSGLLQYKTYLHAALPRIRCKEHGTKTVSVPWARPNCGFTLLFEGWLTENDGVITCDMSLGFRKGILENFPEAHTIIDKFHVVKHCNEAVDKVRKEEAKTNELLRRTKYIWLKNEKNLTENQREKKTVLC
ncbi:MAG: transposase, partial [Treponema sp.]|uniref:transposase n=1 Tax=Treponema sp. TaxID=166 RepID=UPI003611EFC4